MIYDIRLRLEYTYDHPVAGGRHAVRVLPLQRGAAQRVISSSLSFDPPPAERCDTVDFFGNTVVSGAYRDAHAHLKIEMKARVAVETPAASLFDSSDPAALKAEIASVHSLDAAAPHHFLAPSPMIGVLPEITDYARRSLARRKSVSAVAQNLMTRIHEEFTYDSDATDVRTTPEEAFRLKRGVCQDFSHIMIAGLRGIGIPAGYVSGFLRTLPPPGRERLEGADAMHAWVRVWCGAQAGWLEFDPTNAIAAGDDHIAVGVGRDYGDVAPIIGRMRMQGGQDGTQAVDVVPIG